MARFKHDRDWTIYHETAGWDILLVHRAYEFQVGIEAKLSLNAKVLAQGLDGAHRYYRVEGPDYRGVLVPASKCQLHMSQIARAVGLGVIAFAPADQYISGRGSDLPDEKWRQDGWPNWCPGKRCALPDYVPDVTGGHAAPVQLTDWKIKAIKLCIILERRGYVTRRDMKAPMISPTRWCDHWQGLLDPSPERGAYIAGRRTPDLRAQHPVNYAQIEADFDAWATAAEITL